MKNIIIVSKRPQSCYQADAAATCFQTAVKVSIAIFAASILAAAMPTIINWIQSAKCCNTCCGEESTHEPLPKNEIDGAPAEPTNEDFVAIRITPEASSLTNLDYFKKVSTATFGQIAAYFSIAISFASASQLFTLWQAWTVATANCQFDSEK